MSILQSYRYAKIYTVSQQKLEMWANAQRDGRPVEYRWRPLFNAAVSLTPITRVPCINAAKTRSPLKFAWVPQTRQQISAASGRSSPCEDMWGRHCCLAIFFRLSIHALVAEIQPDKLCDGAHIANLLAIVWVLYFQRAARSTIQTRILKSH